MAILAHYVNGNVDTTILEDGTKIREFESVANPSHPESIDLKITDWCDAGCAFCHESSTVKGRHGETSKILQMVQGLPAGVEIAIGGGNPFSYPGLEFILRYFKQLGLISNITINAVHIEKYQDQIRQFQKEKLIYGLGISYNPKVDWKIIESVINSNTVIHLIAGENTVQQAKKILKLHNKILILGYKQYGRGFKYYNPKIELNLKHWKYWITSIMKMGVICFDNLACEQLCIEKQVPNELWTSNYMGNDGTFTMYADAVANQFAISSTSSRVSVTDQTILEWFITNHQ